MSAKGLELISRPITPKEAELVRWLVEHGDEDFRELLDQADQLQVVSKCNCGCPTIYFSLTGDPPSRKGERVISDWLAKMNDEDFGVMLFELSGQISSLEVYSCSGRVERFGLPEPNSLIGYDERSAE